MDVCVRVCVCVCVRVRLLGLGCQSLRPSVCLCVRVFFNGVHISNCNLLTNTLLSPSHLHSNNPAHRYYLATDPVTGQLYVSDTNSRRIYRPKVLTGTKELIQNEIGRAHV